MTSDARLLFGFSKSRKVGNLPNNPTPTQKINKNPTKMRPIRTFQKTRVYRLISSLVSLLFVFFFCLFILLLKTHALRGYLSNCRSEERRVGKECRSRMLREQ